MPPNAQSPLNAPEPPPPPRIPITLERSIGAAAMALICIISFANVVVRYATDISFAFTEEFSVVLLVILTFVGAASAFATDSHLAITFVRDKTPAPIGLILTLIGYGASLIMFGLIVWYGGQLVYDQYRFEETSPGLGYPTWLYTLWLPLLAGVAILRIIGRALRRLRIGR